MRAMAVSLAPGTGLENATCGMLESTLRYLDLTKPSQSGEFDLFLWVRSLLTQASTDALYGVESNPFQDPTVQSGLWTVKKNLSSLMLNILPKILCSEGHHARLAVFAGFRKYYRERGHESASRMIKTRYEVLQQYNLSVEDIAHFDLNVCLGLLINTVPATYWALYYVYSQPSLLEEVREAISPYVQITADGPRRSVNIAEVVVKCPLVTSIVRETLRVQSVSSSARKVLKDTFVDGQYLLKQGSTVLIPTAEVHGPSSVSGTSSSTFDIRRYSSNKASETKKPDSPFRAFGGGSFLCPGRFFAENEMKVILVIMILKYDLETVEHKSWPWPQTRSSLASAIQAPRSDIRVKMLKRKGYESGFWDFEWRGKGTHLDFPTR
ncbi:MAG: hypothetical protein M1836_003652 [Candelina mexicana]|nr:MAG: hypothetical protein M1836_003652 [Candelina mexicana]